MALGLTSKPTTVSKATSTINRKRSESTRSDRRSSFPFNTERCSGRMEVSWLMRRLSSVLRRSTTEGGDEGGTRNRDHKIPDERCMQAYDDTVQQWDDDECFFDASTVYRQQLRAMLQMESETSEFTEKELKRLTRSLSEGDLGQEENDAASDFIDNVIDRYGLMSTDFTETLCIPEGTVVDEEVCYISGAFLGSLEQPAAEAQDLPSTVEEQPKVQEETPPPADRTRTVSESTHLSVPIGNATANEATDASEAVGRTRTFPQRKRSRRVSALLFDTLARRLSKHTLADFKWKRDSMKDILEQEFLANNRGLPDHLSSALSTPVEANEADTVSYDSSTTAKYNLNLPQWARFDLFAKEEYHSWHDKYRHDKISAKVLKKQDAIFELILIEKSHCAHLAFLQQAYRNRLLQEKILVEEDVDRLIPDVLDALLVFHLNLLDRLTARQRESDEVETISDILAEELSDEGKHIGIAISAYTTFGSSKERSEKMFESLMAKNTRFAEFIRTSAQDPLYRQYEFKSTMTRVISRPAKYGLLVETILKNEYNKFTKESELTQKALLAAKRFAMKIDNNLLMAQMAQRWDDVRSHFDHGSHTNLYLVDKDKPNGVVRITFTMEDLDIDMKHVGSGQRRLMCLGDVGMKNAASKVVEKVFMVLFDDILVCLQRRNNQKYVFIQQEQSVFPVNGLILRPADRSASVMIISGAVTKPALLEVEFNSKTDRAKWMKTLETAIHSAPVKVRMSPRNEDEAARQIEIERQLQLKKQKEAEDAWLRKLNEMFEQRSSQERVIQDYMTTLMKFFDDLRTHLQSLPMKSRPDVADRIREAVRQHCRELRSSRTAPLNRLIENVCVARESELWSFIDVSAEMAVDGTPDSDGGGSSSDSSGSGRGQRPRRIHTFHGTTAPPSGQSTSKEHTREKSTIRRHTTVPRMSVGQDGGVDRSDEDDERYEPSEERREQLEVEEKAHRLPLGLNLKARRAMTNLIRDVVKLKTENNHLRNEISLNKTRLAMKERTQHTVVPSVLASDTMEALRRKEQEVREEDARRRRELEQMAEQIRAEQERQRQQEELLKAEKEQLRRSEEELAQKWAALHAATVGGGGSPEGRVVGRISMKSPSAISRMTSFRDQKSPEANGAQMCVFRVASVSQPGISPALRNLTKKSEVKKVKK
ncbi:hypothetical protein Q1695_009028 [Nippostrongylus brasiliensis]|nr:hypothetical protein Q1695_009028 [Nippostrongylus brasiliensis]